MEEKILSTLQSLLKDVANVTRRPNKIGSIGGDSERCTFLHIYLKRKK